MGCANCNEQIKYVFLDKTQIESKEYIRLLQAIHGESGYVSRIKRINHYLESGDFKLLVAIKNGRMIGQASAFKVTAVIRGKEQDLYWGCDTFLLPESRGMGIGKQLQYRLHQACPNFSSAWYSPINGIIKKKCGCKELIDLKFTYYPVSDFFGMLCQLASAKILKHRICFKASIPYLYYNFNNIWCNSKLDSYDIVEIPYQELNQEISDFMEYALQDYDFHVKRSLVFLKWVYGWKLGKYHMLAFKRDNKIQAIVSFSEVHQATHVIASFQGVSVFDLIIHPKSTITRKDILMYVIGFYKRRKEQLDGLITFEQIKYFPKFTYPWPSSPLLSTYREKVSNGYLSFIDQDMDQL